MSLSKKGVLFIGAILAIIHGVCIIILTAFLPASGNVADLRKMALALGIVAFGVMLCSSKLRKNRWVIFAESGLLGAFIIYAAHFLKDSTMNVNYFDIGEYIGSPIFFAVLSISFIFIGVLLSDKSDTTINTTSKDANTEPLKKLKPDGEITEEK
jgi:hypothetical protein